MFVPFVARPASPRSSSPSTRHSSAANTRSRLVSAIGQVSRLGSPSSATLGIVANERRAGKGAAVTERDLPPEASELPTAKAFVIRLTRETGPSLEPFAGRVEHVASGRRARFGDFAAFRAAVTRLLTEAMRS